MSVTAVDPVIFVNYSMSWQTQSAFSDSLLLTYCLCVMCAEMHGIKTEDQDFFL